MGARLGVSFDGFSPFQEAVSFAKEAVASGATSLWMADHLGYRESILSCLGLALATETAEVVPTAVSPYLRHPTPTAMQMATLAEAAPGRAMLAVGVGNPLFLGESGESIDKPLVVIREFIEALRRLWSGEPVDMEAKRFRLKNARMMFKPPTEIPIFLSPMKEQMLKLAGKMANGVVLSAGLSPAYVAQSLQLVAEGASQAKRDLKSIRNAGYISFMASENEKAAIEAVRRKLAFMFRNKYLDDNVSFTGVAVDQEQIIAAMSKRDYEAAAALVSDEAVHTYAVAGTPKQCCDKLQAYADAGFDDLVLLMAGEPDDHRKGLTVIREMAFRNSARSD
jgi:5,10-methylenetetrahydromethanopterin reductase